MGHAIVAAGSSDLRLRALIVSQAIRQRAPLRTCKDAGMQSLRQDVAILDCLPLDRLMPVGGLQDVGRAAITTGSGALRLRSFKRRLALFLLSSSRRQLLGP